MSTPAKLVVICGKVAAGKTTLATELGAEPSTIVISEDVWLSILYPDQMTTLQDYVRCAGMLRSVLFGHVVDLLKAGTSVVLDFPANTTDTRRWMRQIADAAGIVAELHHLDMPDHICKARLQRRNAAGKHPFQVSEAQFEQISRHFSPPGKDEGFTVIRHTVSDRG